MNRSVFLRSACIVLAAIFVLSLSACRIYYKFPQYSFAGRPIPPSLLAHRVLVAIQNPSVLTGGKLQILDAQRDIRSNIQNTVPEFDVSGFSGKLPISIQSFPEQTQGYVYSEGDGTFAQIDYGGEKYTGAVSGLPGTSSSIFITSDFRYVFAANETLSYLTVIDRSTGGLYRLNVPSVYKVAVNTGGTVALAMTRNTNDLYRVVRLNVNQYTTAAAAVAAISGAVDCQPLNLPVYCAVRVTLPSGNLDRPVSAYFSLDGGTAYIENCGPECGGNTASVTFVPTSILNINNLATTISGGSTAVTNLPVPGGVTDLISDGTTLYAAGQQLQTDGLFAGVLSTINLASQTVTGTYSISDGYHTRMIFADNNTLWIGSSLCADGERYAKGENYNCLTRFDLASNKPQIVPSTPIPLNLQNSNNNPNYYGDLTGICAVIGLNKVYTAYGGQIHAFKTADGSEIDNTYITIQGTAYDVAYMDALSNAAN